MISCNQKYCHGNTEKQARLPRVRQQATNWLTLVEILVIIIMPFLYSAATRLPFIYFPIHLMNQFNLDWLTIGLCIASYQGCRVISNVFAIKHPKLSHVIGTLSGLAGYITVFIVDKNQAIPFVLGTAIVGLSETLSPMQKYVKEIYGNDRKKAKVRIKYQYSFVMVGVVFSFLTGGFIYQYYSINGIAIFGMILESLALVIFFIYLLISVKETVHQDPSSPVALTAHDEKDEECCKVVDTSEFPTKCRTMIKDKLELDEVFVVADITQKRALSQSQENSIDTNKDEDDLDVMEMNRPDNIAAIVSPSNNISPSEKSGCHLLDNETIHDADDPAIVKDKTSQEEEEDKNEDKSCHCTETSSVVCSSSLYSMNEAVDRLICSANTDYLTSDLPATWVNWLLCFTFGIQALTIGYTHGIGMIFLVTQFGINTGEIGLLFSIGSAFGTISAIFITCTPFGNDLMRRIVARPFDLCFALGGTAVGAFLACVPNFVLSSVGFILLMAFNDLSSTLLTELQASITTISNYAVLSPCGQIVRRGLNVVTALTGPLLYGVFPRLPFYVTGVITLGWAIMLLIMFKIRIRNTTKIISCKIGQERKDVKRRFSFSTSEAILSVS